MTIKELYSSILNQNDIRHHDIDNYIFVSNEKTMFLDRVGFNINYVMIFITIHMKSIKYEAPKSKPFLKLEMTMNPMNESPHWKRQIVPGICGFFSSFIPLLSAGSLCTICNLREPF